MHLKIDQVTIPGSSLAEMDKAFADIGLTTDYGGPHSNGITHMSLLGFDDGSYIELISSLEPGKKDSAFWGEHIAGNGGPCRAGRGGRAGRDLRPGGHERNHRASARSSGHRRLDRAAQR